MAWNVPTELPSQKHHDDGEGPPIIRGPINATVRLFDLHVLAPGDDYTFKSVHVLIILQDTGVHARLNNNNAVKIKIVPSSVVSIHAWLAIAKTYSFIF